MITVILSGENWVTKATESKEFNNADMRDWAVKDAFKVMIEQGLVNINCVMEDSQSPEWSGLKYSKPYVYDKNGDVTDFIYDDSFRQEDYERSA